MKARNSPHFMALPLLSGAFTAALLLNADVALSQTQSQLITRADARPGAIALVGGTLIDGFGGPPIRNSVILIEGERITRVGTVKSLPIPSGTEVISTEGRSVLPGLWDMHVHLMINGHSNYAHWDRTYLPLLERVIMPASAHQLLLAGVTSARDLGAPLAPSIAVRDAINARRIPGPTMYVADLHSISHLSSV